MTARTLTVSIFFIILAATHTLTAQSAFVLNSKQALSLAIMDLQTQIQHSRPGDVRVHLDTLVVVEGCVYNPIGFQNAIASIIETATDRATTLNNPSPADFGPLWDFEIIDQKITMRSDSAVVDCRFQLLASGLREGFGQLVFVRQGHGWRLDQCDGLLPFLGVPVARPEPTASPDQRKASER